MIRRMLVVVGVVVVLFLVPGVTSAQSMTGAQRAEAQAKLDAFLFNKILVAKVTFPAYKGGIDLKTDGSWNNEGETIPNRGLRDGPRCMPIINGLRSTHTSEAIGTADGTTASLATSTVLIPVKG